MVTKRDPESSPAAFLGNELRRARVAAGFSSQDALAARLGFDRTVITKAETGLRPRSERRVSGLRFCRNSKTSIVLASAAHR